MQRIDGDCEAFPIALARHQRSVQVGLPDPRGVEQVAALDQLAEQRRRRRSVGTGQRTVARLGDGAALDPQLDLDGVATGDVARSADGAVRIERLRPGRHPAHGG